MGRIEAAMDAHRAAFGTTGCGLFQYPPEEHDMIAGMLEEAIRAGRPLTDGMVRAALGWTPLPDGVDI